MCWNLNWRVVRKQLCFFGNASFILFNKAWTPDIVWNVRFYCIWCGWFLLCCGMLQGKLRHWLSRWPVTVSTGVHLWQKCAEWNGSSEHTERGQILSHILYLPVWKYCVCLCVCVCMCTCVCVCVCVHACAHSFAISSVTKILWPRRKGTQNIHFLSQIIY
jgi:hypothetical protein